MHLNTSHKVDPFIHIPVSLSTYLITARQWQSEYLESKIPRNMSFVGVDWALKGLDALSQVNPSLLDTLSPVKQAKSKLRDRQDPGRQPSHTLASGIWGQMSGP